jgi:hypothetical protein
MITARLMYDVSRNWTFGIDHTSLASHSWNNWQYANGVELGRILRKNMWLSAGYNYTGVYDRDLTGEDATRRGPFIRLRFKWDETNLPFLKQEQVQ